MAIIQTISANDSFNKYLYIIDPFKTSNATQTTAYSISVPAGSSFSIDGEFFCSDVAFTNCARGTFQAMFLRNSSGNVARTSATAASGLATSILGNFSSSQPSIDIVANTTTQSIDIKLTGKASTIIDWHVELTVFRSN